MAFNTNVSTHGPHASSGKEEERAKRKEEGEEDGEVETKRLSSTGVRFQVRQLTLSSIPHRPRDCCGLVKA